ncbi:hypothetical protein LTR28_001905, partial [Elasticomyces elasticus]
LLELHVHGGPAIVKVVLASIPLCAPPSAKTAIRYAEPGEFTRRAFLNGRLDLTQIEALGDTLHAATEQQRRLSVRGTTSGLAKRYDEWRTQLLLARGELEALIDFSEDQHFDESPTTLAASVAVQVRALKRLLELHSTNAVRGELLRNGITLSLLGAPNAGKSSLLNRIVGREAAIVSREAGTTRDVVEVGIDLGGYFCRIGDTAGLRRVNEGLTAGTGHDSESSVSSVEKEGIKRAKARAMQSDVVVVVLSFDAHYNPQTLQTEVALHFDPEVVETANTLIRDRDNVIVLINKTDIAPIGTSPADWLRHVQNTFPHLNETQIFCVSCKDAEASSPHDKDPGNIQAFLSGLVSKFTSITSAATP